MKKNTIIYSLLVFLVIMNMFFLYNYMFKPTNINEQRQQNNKDFIVSELGFSEEQKAEFRKKSISHHEAMRRLNDEIKILKDELFGKLSDDMVNDGVIDSITSLIGEKEKSKEQEVFRHFKMIQELSNDKQKEKFKMIIMDALRRNDRGANRIPPPPREENNRIRPPRN